MNDPTSVRLQPVKLSANKTRHLRAAYANGDLELQVMMNVSLFEAGTFLAMLPCAPLSPTHFLFTGNRRYRMQVVTNGEIFGVLTQGWTRSDPNMARLELIIKSELPFMLVSQPPTLEQIKTLHADVVERAVVLFDALGLPPEQQEAYQVFCTPMSGSNSVIENLRANPHQAREILAAHAASGAVAPPSRFFKGPSNG